VGQLAGLIDLIEAIPEELLTMDSASYDRFICSKAHIKQRLVFWTANPNQGHDLGIISGGQQSPVILIRDALLNCPDESPGPATAELSFIPDVDLRANLRNDIGAINRALSNGEWKAATVLAGSTIEALLLWALQGAAPAATAAAAALVTSGVLPRQPAADLERWNLHEYIAVAENLTIITPDTAVQTKLAKDFRNLIHPGRAQRLGQNCSRATALSAVAGVEFVVRDLTP